MARYTLPPLLQRGLPELMARFDARLARYTLPSLLQGHPPSQGSGTLMSLQEGIAVLRARMVVLKPSCPDPSGRCPDVPTEPPPYPATNLRLPASCLRYLTPVFPLPVPAHSSQAECPAVRSPTHSRTLPRITGRREREVGERPVCSVATSGCPTRSEDGFPAGARNIPPRPVQPKRHPKLLAQPPHPT